MCQLWQFLKKLVHSTVTAKASDDRLHLHVSRHRENGRIRFKKGFNFSQKASRVNLPTHTTPWWNNLQVSQKKKLDDVRVRSEEMSTDLHSIANRSKRPQANWQAQCFYTFSSRSRSCRNCLPLRFTATQRRTKLRCPITNQVLFTQIIRWSLFALVKTNVGITTRQPQTDQRPTGLVKTKFARSKKVLLLFWFSRVFQKSGGEEQWIASVICETYK